MSSASSTGYTPAQYDRAAEWLIVEDMGELSSAQRTSMNAWLDSDPANRAAMNAARLTWSRAGVLDAEDVDPSTIVPVPSLPRRFASTITAVAASLLVAVIGAYALWPESGDPISTYATGVAVRERIQLADGSSVELDARSRIDVSISDDERAVKLHHGGAHFDVSSEPKRPFIVQANAATVRVTGTAFEIRLLSDQTVVSVFSGTVTVMGDGRSVELTTAETTSVDANGALSTPSPFNMEATEAWRQGLFIFDEMELSRVVAELNSYYGNTFELVDPNLGALLVTGTFQRENAAGIRAALEATLPVSVQADDEGQFLIVPASPR